MPRPRERRWPGLVAGYILLLLVVGGLTTAFYVSVAEIHQALVIRLAVAALVAIVLIHIHRTVRCTLAYEPPSDFERALRPEPLAMTADPLLLKLREELHYSVASRRYFRHVLWPRLVALAEQSGKSTLLREPRASWAPRRGPSLDSVASRRYFRHVLWPRLVALAEQSGKSTLLREPRASWAPRRGPSLETLAAVIKQLEEKP